MQMERGILRCKLLTDLFSTGVSVPLLAYLQVQISSL